MQVITAKDMQVGDTVQMHFPDPLPWSTCVVRQIADGRVHLFRPYATTADFTTTSGVICYIGIEEYQIELTSSVTYRLLERSKTLK